jgi:predicted amidohydrolase YtcJ
MMLLSENIFKIDPSRVRDARVDITITGGRIVHPAAGAGPA